VNQLDVPPYAPHPRRAASRLHAPLLLLMACASPARPVPATPAMVSARQPEREQTVAAAPLVAEDLTGVWVEYWALSGRADTQHYAFASDASFEWRAAPNAPAGGITRSWGKWALQPNAILLEVAGQEHGSTCQGVACTATPEAHVVERLSIGACPPDREAQVLDSSYHCVSIDGRAFWRRAAR
jgi:hypothetical protein